MRSSRLVRGIVVNETSEGETGYYASRGPRRTRRTALEKEGQRRQQGDAAQLWQENSRAFARIEDDADKA
jgi:hypothetical protein